MWEEKKKDLSAAELRISLIVSYKTRRRGAMLLALVTGEALPITPLSRCIIAGTEKEVKKNLSLPKAPSAG